jgi:hypothetical protein
MKMEMKLMLEDHSKQTHHSNNRNLAGNKLQFKQLLKDKLMMTMMMMRRRQYQGLTIQQIMLTFKSHQK